MSKHYDVIVLGSGIGALVSAAVLARRSWRVLLVGQGRRPPTYSHEGTSFARRNFSFALGQSSAWTKVIGELAEKGTFRRRAPVSRSALQLVTPTVRLDFFESSERFARELQRSYPGDHERLTQSFARLEADARGYDALFGADAIVPPRTAREEKELERTLGGLLAASSASGLRGLGHAALEDALAVYTRFLTNRRGPTHPVALRRFAGTFRTGTVDFDSGEEGFVDFLVERAKAHGAEVAMESRLVEVVHERGRVKRIVTDDGGAAKGADYLVAELGARELVDHASNFDSSDGVVSELPRLLQNESRLLVNVVLRSDAVPAALGSEAFFVAVHAPGGSTVPVRVRRVGAAAPDGLTVLAFEVIASDAYGAEGVTVDSARDRVLEALTSTFPFVARHVVMVDSPHDGRPLWDYRSGARVLRDRVEMRGGGATRVAEAMAPRYDVDRSYFHDLAVDPLASPFKNAFHVGPTVLPSLGAEGELMAAVSVLKILRGLEPKKESIGGDFRRKVEW